MRFSFLRRALGLAARTLSVAACVVSAQAQSGGLSADVIIPHPPPTMPLSEWKDDGPRKTITLKSGIATLHGYRYASTAPNPCELLFFNGNGMMIGRTDRLYRGYATLGCNVTVYDYRGYGFTEGKAHLADFRDDGLKIYDTLVKATPGGKVIVFGASMGTTVAAYVASKRPLAGLILGMPIASAKAELPVYGLLVGFTKDQIERVDISYEANQIYNEIAMVKPSQAPLLVLGGEKDTIVPDAQAKAIFEASTAPSKLFVEVPGAGHNDVIISPTGVKAIATFIQQVSAAKAQ